MNLNIASRVHGTKAEQCCYVVIGFVYILKFVGLTVSLCSIHVLFLCSYFMVNKFACGQEEKRIT